jgi:hypothetical protein
VAELDHRAADRPAEGWTVTSPGLLGEARPLGLAGVSDPLIRHATPQLCAC